MKKIILFISLSLFTLTSYASTASIWCKSNRDSSRSVMSVNPQAGTAQFNDIPFKLYSHETHSDGSGTYTVFYNQKYDSKLKVFVDSNKKTIRYIITLRNKNIDLGQCGR